MSAKKYHLKRSSVIVVLTIIVLSLPQQAILAQAQTGTTIHIVAWGETLSSIAARYGVTLDELAACNHLTQIDRIYAGQQLIIPNTFGDVSTESTNPSTHIVQAGENLYRISLIYGVSVQTLVTANSLPDEDHVFVGQSLIIPPSDGRIAGEVVPVSDVSFNSSHIVQSGETLSEISQAYGVSIIALQAANGLLNPSRIFVGQRLTIPDVANEAHGGKTSHQVNIVHIVQPGENLFFIAAHYGVSMWAISQSNNISNPSLIYPGQALSIPDNGALMPVTEGAGISSKSIVVDISEQRAYIYDGGETIQNFLISTGVPGRDTRRGNFQIQNKIPVAYAATWDLQMPYWLGFYWSGPLQNGFHALPILPNGLRLWEGLLGRPASYGCVILGEEAARWLYEWAEIGTPVTVQD